MNVIEATRELGKSLQADPRYGRMQEISTLCDKDQALQDMIGQFNLTRMNLNQEAQKPDKDEQKVNQLKKSLEEIYGKIMQNPNMMLYNTAQQEMDALLKQVYGILSKCADGEDPSTANYEPESCAAHDCSSCGGSCGCHEA